MDFHEINLHYVTSFKTARRKLSTVDVILVVLTFVLDIEKILIPKPSNKSQFRCGSKSLSSRRRLPSRQIISTLTKADKQHGDPVETKEYLVVNNYIEGKLFMIESMRERQCGEKK